MRNGLFPLLCALCLGLLFFPSPCRADEATFDLESAIRFALKHNPSLRISEKDVATEKYGIEAAKAERMPKVDFGSGATRYRYPTPLTPLVLPSPFTLAALQALEVPDFERTIYDAGASFRLPLYRGGRITANIRVAEMRKALAQDNYRVSEQDLIYNVTSVYHKILQLQKLLAAHDASVAQLESHYRDVEFFLKAGTAPRLDLLKTEVDLAHAKDNLLLVRNNLDSAFELLKNLMGMEDAGTTIAVVEPKPLRRNLSVGRRKHEHCPCQKTRLSRGCKKEGHCGRPDKGRPGEMVSRYLRVRPIYKKGGRWDFLSGRLVSRA